MLSFFLFFSLRLKYVPGTGTVVLHRLTGLPSVGIPDVSWCFLFCRYMGPSPGGGENLQAAKLGNGVQALVPGPQNPLVLGWQARAQIQTIGKSIKAFNHTYTCSPVALALLPFASSLRSGGPSPTASTCALRRTSCS